MRLWVILAGLVFVVMWSSAFASARIILLDAPPLLTLALRFSTSGLLAILLARALGQDWHLPGGWRGAQARAVVLFGLCQNALYLGLFFVAMQWIEASMAAIIASSMPLMVALLGWGFRGEKIAGLGVLGLILGMIGVGLIMGTRLQGGADGLGILLCLFGALALAVATLTLRGASGGGNLLMVVGMQMLVGALPLALLSLLLEDLVITPSWSWALAMAYQILVPGLAATLIWFWLVGQIGAVRAATFHFLNPFTGVVIAALLLGEEIRAMDMLGVAIAMAGIFLVQNARVAAQK